MITVTFKTVTNKTDFPIIFSQFLYQKGAAAREQEMFTVPADKTVQARTTIALQTVDENIGSTSFLIKKAEDPNIQLHLLITWGENFFIDVTLQNLNTQESINLPTLRESKEATQDCDATLDITVMGNEFEKSEITIAKITN